MKILAGILISLYLGLTLFGLYFVAAALRCRVRVQLAFESTTLIVSGHCAGRTRNLFGAPNEIRADD